MPEETQLDRIESKLNFLMEHITIPVNRQIPQKLMDLWKENNGSRGIPLGNRTPIES